MASANSPKQSAIELDCFYRCGRDSKKPNNRTPSTNVTSTQRKISESHCCYSCGAVPVCNGIKPQSISLSGCVHRPLMARSESPLQNMLLTHSHKSIAEIWYDYRETGTNTQFLCSTLFDWPIFIRVVFARSNLFDRQSSSIFHACSVHTTNDKDYRIDWSVRPSPRSWNHNKCIFWLRLIQSIRS